ncbi:MAG: hypothetical protein PHI28_16305, partial [Mangrovibacterium sp.]|nr:hypothetical protein [Mangrovibacterium sp.]
FKVMDLQVIQQPGQALVVRFSDPLLPDQELNGLITIDGSGEARYEVDYNALKVYLPEHL